MKKLSLLLAVLFFLGCQTDSSVQARKDQSVQTKIIISNIGKADIESLWFSFDDEKISIGNIKSGEIRVVYVTPIGKKRVDYGFKGDDAIRSRMGGELYFLGNHIPGRAGIYEVSFNNGLIHKTSSQQ